MTKHKYALLLLITIAITYTQLTSATKLVILHTNDTHSQIDPDENNLGGILRRKVLIDSVRATERNVLLVDAGDAVQGTLYYLLFKGEVESKMMNELGYEIAILGNHEFDNGLDPLHKQLSTLNATKISTNYDLSKTLLDSLFVPFEIKEYDGKRIGIIGLGIAPKGMISSRNCHGVEYLDAIKAANATAWHLKHHLHTDAIIALTHVGYDSKSLSNPNDLEIARNTENIDIIIGGHSHTTINASGENSPIHEVANLAGDTVLIAQAGGTGRYLGEITLDIENRKASSRLISVDKRLDNRIDTSAEKILQPYRHIVDSLMSIKVAISTIYLDKKGAPLINLISDFIYEKGKELSGENIDVAIMNKGGIRNSLPKGDISKGHIMMTFPFENFITIMEISGKDLAETFNIIVTRNNAGISKGAEIIFNPQTKEITDIFINGKPIDNNKTYRVATIDYLAGGGDYLSPLINGKTILTSKNPLSEDLIKYLLSYKKKLNPPTSIRIHSK